MSDFGRIVHESKSTSMSHVINPHSKPQHAGLRLRRPARYDLLVWLLTHGRPRRLRERMLEPAKLRRGERVLDVSCGTGSLALLAKEQVGPEGRVHGIDASEEMIAFARTKAKRAGIKVAFDVAPAQALPFADASFDVVLNTLALHHLPRPSRYQSLSEFRRVLKPDGRALIIDFAEGEKKRGHGLFGPLKHRHGSVPPDETAAAMRAAGFKIAGSGPIGVKSLHFVLGGSSEVSDCRAPEKVDEAIRSRSTAHVAAGAGAVVLVLLLLHGAAGAAMIHATRSLGSVKWIALGVVVFIAGLKWILLRRFQRR